MKIQVGTLTISEKAKTLVNEVLDSNWLSYGPKTKEFEKKFAEAHRWNYAIFMSSGTSALHVAFQAMKEQYEWPDGSEVLIPALTFPATANIVYHNNMVPVPVDVQRDTYNLDPFEIERHITGQTRAIIPVHLMGLPCDMVSIMDIAERRGLRILEDSCESLLNVPVEGDIACFSTYVSHLLVTGVGGFALTNDYDLHRDMRKLMNHGQDVPGVFEFSRRGHSFRATEMEAALGLAMMDDISEQIIKRQNNAQRLTDLLSDLMQLKLPIQTKNAFMVYPLTVLTKDLTSERQRNFTLPRWLNWNKIETRDILPLVNQKCYDWQWQVDEWPVARNINRNGFYIGCHQDLTGEDLEYISEVIHGYFK